VSTVNEIYNTDFTAEKQNRKPKSRKRKRAVLLEWKINETKMLRNTGHTYRNFKRGTDVPERKIAPLRATGRLKCYFRSYPSGKDVMFPKDIGLCQISEPK